MSTDIRNFTFCVMRPNNRTQQQHTDASQETTLFQVVLVAAKAKVPPKKAQTIPRFELQAAFMGARLAETIKREHDIGIGPTTYCTDSFTVIHWIKNDTRRCTPFVAYRIGKIAELTKKEEWR